MVVHEYNGKYIVEVEGGRCKQGFKFDKEQYDLSTVQAWVLDNAEQMMEQMHKMHEWLGTIKSRE
jgi:hypothetical protein